ncbi:RnfABCDGE type electron transport complex subunit D [uncultured Fusobacterium sp.]|uniref:RnfABCDGE type electron transport complex subunit D n=1 Tax=uncultured Fusobacterium sp. TaxID=159267 RepID=UPI0015A55B40|nr:RnfABCDGE type electron transport complex subunit D [uncultured Fusobacterium sp.]
MGPSPHIRTSETVDKVMLDVIIALVPALLMAVYVFKTKALIVTAVSVIFCMLTEFVFNKIRKKECTLHDKSAIVTGLLFAFVIPVDMSLPFVAIGAIVSIALGKMFFGGLGCNIFNPALVGRAFVQASWPVAITTFSLDGVAGPTMLDAMKRGLPMSEVLIGEGNMYVQALIGKMGGCLGETSAIAILLGGAYLIYKKQIDWKMPLVIIGTVAVFTTLLGAKDPIMQIISGGLLLGAFFMATDMVTSPVSTKGKLIYAFGIGFLISMIRMKGGYPEGTAFSILIMNGVVPLINRYTMPKKFGEVKADGKK